MCRISLSRRERGYRRADTCNVCAYELCFAQYSVLVNRATKKRALAESRDDGDYAVIYEIAFKLCGCMCVCFVTFLGSHLEAHHRKHNDEYHTELFKSCRLCIMMKGALSLISRH